ncbi:MAG: DUF58 domain-containing protein [Butyrivibrio sp.]|nr:DUF58 domain-containing protein [Acetatifactor muris]MCM1558350.1 DUF58 domain-containing protein [Butyrivibrio sp.]
MIKLSGIGLLFFLLFLLQKAVYRRLWNKNLTVDIRFVREHIFEGEESALQEIIRNEKKLPLPMLKVKFRTDRRLLFGDSVEGARTTDQFYRNDMFRVGGGEKITRTLKFTGGRRGFYEIDGADLVASDIFLTDQMVAEAPLHGEIYVYPRPYDSPEMRQSLTWLNGEVLSRRYLLEDPFEYRGIREYQVFDDMRSINWKATARTGGLKVNQKNYTALKSVRIFLNVEDTGIMKKDECVEASLRLAAGLSAFFLKQGIQTACYGNGVDIKTHEPLVIGAKAGDGQFDAICRGLARLDTEQPVADFAGCFEERLFSEAAGTVTCFVAPNQYADFLELLERFADAGNEFCWFYPVSGKETPELPEKLRKQVRLIHIDC